MDNVKSVKNDAPGTFGSLQANPFLWRDVRTIPPRQWLLGSSLLRGSLSLLIAPGGSGKTALTVGMAVSLVTGRDLLGMKVWGGPKKVMLWNLEDSQEEIDKLFYAAFKKWDVLQDHVGERLYVNSGLAGDGLTIATDEKGVVLNKVTLNDLVSLISTLGIDVLIVDPFVSSHRVSENDNGAIDAIAKAWANIANVTGCAVLLVHHTSKLRGSENTSEASRGASALVNAARSVTTINRMTKTQALNLGVEEHEHSRHFRCYDDKNNRAPPAAESKWFALESVSLGNHPLGCDGDSVAVVVPWSSQLVVEQVTNTQIREVQKRISDGNYRKDSQSPDWVGIVIAEVLERDLSVKNVKAAIKKLVGEWASRGFLAEETRKDHNRTNRLYIVAGEVIPQ
ncbi:MAG: AAA family ATPase [Sphingomonadaceae bacterium]|jgi:hypothetical protein|nr:AAA family ATPase [Sphingomonadaceae bacterium]